MEINIDSSSLEIIVAIALGLAIVIFLLVGLKRLIFRVRGQDLDRKLIERKWQEIEKLISVGSEASWELAVLEADKLLDLVLKQKMFPGITLGERLKAAGYKYSQLRSVWPAHKLRNCLVHEADFQLKKRTAIWAVRSFKQALRVLGGL